MAKFRFYQDKEVRTWVRDYFRVEAETLDEAIEYVMNMGCTLEDEECNKGTKVEFERRDWDWITDCLAQNADSERPLRYGFYSCDLEDEGALDSEVAYG